MADYKSYIVNYDIRANVKDAVGVFRTMARAVDQLQAPLSRVAADINTVAQSMNLLKTNAKDFVFKPTVDLTKFNAQLKTMQESVVLAAREMRAAIYNALQGNQVGTNMVKNAANKAMKGGIAQWRSEIATLEKELEKIWGAATRTKSGRSVRKGGLLQDKNLSAERKAQLQEEKRSLQNQIKARQDAIAAQQKEDKRLLSNAQKQAKAVNAQAKKVASANVTPATIKAWEKAFGPNSKVKTLTVHIRGKADGPKGAITVINQVKNLLKNINPPTIPVNLKAQTGQLTEQLKAFKAPTITITAKLSGVKGLQNQIQKLSGTAPSGISGRGSVGNAAQKASATSATPQGIWSPKTHYTDEDNAERNRLLAKGRRLTAGERDTLKSLNRRRIESLVGRRVSDEEFLNAAKNQAKIERYQGMTSLTKSQQAAYDKAKSYMSSLRPKQLPYYAAQGGTDQQQLAALNGKTATVRLLLDTTAAVTTLNEFVAQVRATTATMKLGAVGAGTNAATANTGVATGGKTGGTTQPAGQGVGTRGTMPYVQRGPATKGVSVWGTEARAKELMGMRSDARAAFSQLTPYEKQEIANQKSLAAQRTARKAASTRGRMVPIAENNAQLKMLTQYRRYFEWAAAKSGFNLTAGSNPFSNAAYMAQVASLMRNDGVMPPDRMLKAAGMLPAPTRGGGRVGAAPKPFDSQARKLMYPLTGPTSFGVRTPMVVDMAKGMGMMFAISGAMSAIGNSFSQAMEYQNTMETTRAILKTGTNSYSQSSFGNMERVVRDVGIKTKFSAPEVASAARFLAMAGYDIESINNAIRPIADLALIGDYDLGETADKMTNIMTTFGADPAALKSNPALMRQMGNIMNAVATRSNTDVMMLAESAKYGGGVAHMYNKNDPNIFADTMAIFGVMGNAGIQGSSAGTALRMMYQNIFNPNKKQAAILENLQSRGLKLFKSDGSKNSMGDILMWMANNLNDLEQSDIVSKLFRITAQPGANAAIQAAVNQNLSSLASLVAEEGTNAEEVIKGYQSLTDAMGREGGLGSLAKLMLAARQSVFGDALGENAKAKQNTIQGLWAQVTSTFTEGIVQAFQQRQGGIEGMLKELREWLAKPETIQMLQNLLDLIIAIGKAMAQVAGIWAKMYSLAPNLAKAWIVGQMLFTQLGSLLMPFMALINLVGMFRGMVTGVMAYMGGNSLLAGMFGAGGGAVAAGAAGAARATAGVAAPVITGGIAGAATTSSTMLEAGAAGAMMAGAGKTSWLKRAWGGTKNIGKSFMKNAWRFPALSGVTPFLKGAGSILLGMANLLARALGLLLNPITIAAAALGGLIYVTYKTRQFLRGETEAQIIEQKAVSNLAEQTKFEIANSGKWFQELQDSLPKPPGQNSVTMPSDDMEDLAALKEQRKVWANRFGLMLRPFNKDSASLQSVNAMRTGWKDAVEQYDHYKWALGGNSAVKQLDPKLFGNMRQTGKYYNPEYPFASLPELDVEDQKRLVENYINNPKIWIPFYSLLAWGTPSPTKAMRQESMRIATEKMQLAGAQDMIRVMAADSPEVQEGMRALRDLIARYQMDSNKTLGGEDFNKEASVIIAKYAGFGNGQRTIDAEGWSPFQVLSNLSSLPKTYQYGQAIASALRGAIDVNAPGSLTGALMAQEELATGEVQAFSQRWYEDVMQVIHGMTVSIPTILNGQVEYVTLTVKNAGGGKIDFSSVLSQIQQQGNNFKMTLNNWAQFLAGAYKLMAEHGNIDWVKDRAQIVRSVGEAMVKAGAQYTSDDIETYYNYIKSDPNNPYSKFSVGTLKKVLTDPKYSKDHKIRLVDKNGATLIETTKGKGLQDVTEKLINKAVNDNTPDTNNNYKIPRSGGGGRSNNHPKAPSQDQYASSYNRNAAKPTHVSINIGTLANFDKTTIASSADERDLMMSMEAKIANTVYQIFAEASNQAQNYSFNA